MQDSTPEVEFDELHALFLPRAGSGCLFLAGTVSAELLRPQEVINFESAPVSKKPNRSISSRSELLVALSQPNAGQTSRTLSAPAKIEQCKE